MTLMLTVQTLSMSEALDARGPSNSTRFRLAPLQNQTVTVTFRPSVAGTARSAFVVRNNLTTVEILRAVGETGRYTFGFPKVVTFDAMRISENEGGVCFMDLCLC